MKKTIILVLVLAGVGTGGWYWLQGRGDTAAATESFDSSLFAVARGDLIITITENGTLVAKESQNVRSEIRGHSKIEWLIEEGKHLLEEGKHLVESIEDAAARFWHWLCKKVHEL